MSEQQQQQQQPLDPQDIEAYLLGVLPEYRVEALDQSLRSDPVALQQLAQAMQVMSLVRQEFAGQAQYQAANEREPLLEDFNSLLKELGEHEAAAEPITLTPANPPQQQARIDTDKFTAHDLAGVGGYVLRKALTSKPALYAGVTTAAAAVLLLALILINPFASNAPAPIASDPSTIPPSIDNPATTTNPVATLTATHNAQWGITPAERALARGSKLHPDTRLTLTAGFAEITTNHGAIAILEAPAIVELLDNDNALRLHSGKLVGICETESSKGFLVRTPHLDITDLGTRFGVDLTRPDQTQVHVLQGEVKVNPLTSDGVASKGETLTEGQAVIAYADQRQLQETVLEPQRFASIMTNKFDLPGTGQGLTNGDIDPNWSVVAVDGNRLEQALPLKVGRVPVGSRLGTPRAQPARSIWLRGDDIDVPRSGKETVFTCQASFEFPAGVKPGQAALVLNFDADESVARVRLNGHALDTPANSWSDDHEGFNTMRIETALQNGVNTIELDVVDLIQFRYPTIWGLNVRWHLEASTAGQP